MQRRAVVMALIPGIVRRGATTRSDLRYAKYSRATWEWWCRQHEADFVVLESPPQDKAYAAMPPTLQRWVMIEQLIAERGEGAQVITVDADTMVRWDMPDLFTLAHGFSVVPDSTLPDWIAASIATFHHLFPETSLPWWEYFNSGVVVLGAEQRRIVHALLDFVRTDWPQVNAAIKDGGFGTDQPLINFIVRREKEPIHFLPRPFNFLHCFPMEGELVDMQFAPNPDHALFAEKAFARPWAFNFINYAYVWHFTNVYVFRSAVMRETWLRVRGNYPGAICDEP